MRIPKGIVAIVTVLGFAAGAAAALARLPVQKNSTNKGAQATMLAPDKGKFRIALNGQVVGSEEFEISSSGNVWMARGSTTIRVPGRAEVKSAGRLNLSADGTPTHYEWSAQTEKKASGVVEFANSVAHTSTDLGAAAPFTQDFTFPAARIAVLDNNLYYQYAVLAQLYDWKAGGKQTFPVLIPQNLTPGSISVESLGAQQVEGAKYEALRVTSQDLEILLYVDADHRLARIEVPASNVVILRE